MNAMDPPVRPVVITPETLRKVGEAIYGRCWQTPLAALLNVQARTVRRWASGESSMPMWLSRDLLRVVEDRALKLRLAGDALETAEAARLDNALAGR